MKKKGSFYQAKYNALKFRLGSHSKATVAIANRMARAMYYIIKDDKEAFKEIGEFRADKAEQQLQRAIRKIKSLGYQVDIKNKQATVTS